MSSTKSKHSSEDTQRSRVVRGPAEFLLVAIIGLASCMLYALIYFIQRAIFTNGLQLDGIVTGEPANVAALVWQYGSYCVCTIALFMLYLFLLLLCREGKLNNPRVRLLVLLFPLLINIGLVFSRPYYSSDTFTNIAHGYIGSSLHGNPYVLGPSDIKNTPFGDLIASFLGLRLHQGVTPYGPLWTHIEVSIMRLTSDVWTAMTLMKLVIATASMGSGAVIWFVVGRIQPSQQLLGTLLYLWNPVVIIEFAAEGHNDAIMIFFVLLSVLFTIYQRPIMSFGSLTLSVATKFVPVILFPPQLMYLWRARTNSRSLVLHLVGGALFGLGVLLLLYQPFWVGMATFRGLQEQGQPRFVVSTIGALFWVMSKLNIASAALVAVLIADSLFVAYIVFMSWQSDDRERWLESWGNIAVMYVLVASPVYWPWYATLPIALLAVRPSKTSHWLIFILSLSSRLMAPINTMFNNGFMPWSLHTVGAYLIGVAVPLVIFLLLSAFSIRRTPSTSSGHL